MASGRSSTRARGDVHWFVPGRKTAVAYSTSATSQLIGLLAEDGHTFVSARHELRYDTDGVAVVDAYIARGLGDVKMTDLGVRF